jgi:hypothetical protein
VLDQLLDLEDADAPLNAVVGLGVSIDLTEQAAKRLAAADIPTVGAITTARQLNYQNIEGFVRVAPSDRDYVAGLRAYLAERPGLDSAILVYDRNSESRGDIFIDSLRSELTDQMGELIKFPALSFVGKSQASDADPTLFTNIINSICAVAPKVVFFAGRKTDLRDFLDSLGSRTCPELPMTVITADADLNVFGEETSQDKKITLVYADATDPSGWVSGVVSPPDGIADATDPSGWVSGVARPPDGFLEFKTSFENLGFPVGHLNDGMAISYHDAVLTAARAIRLADVSIEGPDVPQATDVLNQMLNLNGQFQVLGASGTLNYSYRGTDGKESGDPVGKPIPVVELHSSGNLPVTKGAYYIIPE